MKFNVNLLKLQEVLVSEIRMKGITSIHNSRRLQKKVKESITAFDLFVYHLSQKRSLLGHFTGEGYCLFKGHYGHILYYNMKLRSSGGAIFDQSGNFLSSSWNRTSIFSIER